MRDTAEGFIGRGGNVAFFSGNTSFWQVRLEGAEDGGPAPTMVGYKGRFKRDPVYDTDRVGELTSMWSDHLIGRPENHLTGVSFSRGGYHRIGRRVTNGAGGYTVHRPDHWMFDGTGVGYGDVLGAAATVVGYECDGCDFTYRDGLPHPTGVDGTPLDFTILGTVPAAHFTRTTSTRPPPPNAPSEVEFIAARMVDGGRTPEDVENPKGRLQEMVQPTLGNNAVRYEVLAAIGEDHQREYEVAVYVMDQLRGTGRGTSKKLAEEAAARAALGELRRGTS
jgi:hypothetical protein